METVVINKIKGEKNTPKFKYKFNSSEAIALYIAIYVVLFIICKFACLIPGTWKYSMRFYEWYPVIIPFVSIIVFAILFSTKLVITSRLDLFKKYVIFAEAVTIFRMWYGTYSILIKNSSGRFIENDILAINFLILQLLVMGVSLIILKCKSKCASK